VIVVVVRVQIYCHRTHVGHSFSFQSLFDVTSSHTQNIWLDQTGRTAHDSIDDKLQSKKRIMSNGMVESGTTSNNLRIEKWERKSLQQK
jgi:hypothetical protein